PGGADKFVMLEETISKEPLGPVVRRGDEEWGALVKWVLFALIEAEERGVTRENVRALQKKTDPALQWFLNASGQHGKSLGVKPGWVAEVVQQVGNYGEIYDRSFGPRSALKIDRGMNRLWNRGGLIFSPPFQ
ncbi:MAG TPA: amino acid ABC transporter substrate-binding protein, partial [Thermodesulfobacteriota bacterium]|nr:amino acid ABC transporter substrate-binding protein [Thermodesulfobacteriota bacterium]